MRRSQSKIFGSRALWRKEVKVLMDEILPMSSEGALAYQQRVLVMCIVVQEWTEAAEECSLRMQ